MKSIGNFQFSHRRISLAQGRTISTTNRILSLSFLSLSTLFRTVEQSLFHHRFRLWIGRKISLLFRDVLSRRGSPYRCTRSFRVALWNKRVPLSRGLSTRGFSLVSFPASIYTYACYHRTFANIVLRPVLFMRAPPMCRVSCDLFL